MDKQLIYGKGLALRDSIVAIGKTLQGRDEGFVSKNRIRGTQWWQRMGMWCRKFGLPNTAGAISNYLSVINNPDDNVLKQAIGIVIKSLNQDLNFMKRTGMAKSIIKKYTPTGSYHQRGSSNPQIEGAKLAWRKFNAKSRVLKVCWRISEGESDIDEVEDAIINWQQENASTLNPRHPKFLTDWNKIPSVLKQIANAMDNNDHGGENRAMDILHGIVVRIGDGPRSNLHWY